MQGKIVKIYERARPNNQQGKLSLDSSDFGVAIVLGDGINVTMSMVNRIKTGSQSIIISPKNLQTNLFVQIYGYYSIFHSINH
jgi:hypothetical protein